ncbi:hypothetical protein DsansV1_C25g0188581 [Dioscorea sansibarensis]
MGWWTIGWPARGNNGFGTLSDSGRNLVPTCTKSPKNSSFAKQINGFPIRNTFGWATNHDHCHHPFF